jgi:hypothetical protein
VSDTGFVEYAMTQAPATAEAIASGAPLHDELRDALLRSLTIWRQHILHAFDDLTESELRRPVLPSGWSYAGLVRHLTWDVEQFWFQAVQAGEPMDLDAVTNAWIVPDSMTTAEVIANYESAIARNDAIVRTTPLDADPIWWPNEIFPDMPPRPMHRTILHVLTETASHAEHLDIARELIDRRQWLVLT